MMISRIVLPVVLGMLFLPGVCSGAEARTFDQMNDAELKRISDVTLAYYLCISDRLDTVTDADKSTPERILATYPPYIRILRQQCRIKLLDVEKELYFLRLNPEFVTNYVVMLRDDVEHFALQQVLKKAAAAQAEAK